VVWAKAAEEQRMVSKEVVVRARRFNFIESKSGEARKRATPILAEK
jgi:hypothetical protein